MEPNRRNIAVINTLADVYSSHRDYTGLFSKIRTAEWSNIFLSPAVLLIATILKNAGHHVRIYNDVQKEIIHSQINEDIILISSITSSFQRACEIARQFRDRKVIMGGIHVSCLPDEALNYADHIVIGECENVITALVEGKIKDKIIYGTRLKNLDDLPFFDYSLLKHFPEIIPVQTSRGCDFKCMYCTVAANYGKYRARSPENIINELKHYCENYGSIRKIDFRIDADFTFIRKRAIEIIQRLNAEGIKPEAIIANSRLQIYKDHELLSLLSKLNTTLCIGIESLDQEVLNVYNKEQKETDISEAVRTFHDFNIKVMGYFIFGSDQDHKDTLKRYSEFIHKSKIDFFQVSLLTPFPGTELYKTLSSQNRILTKNWSYYDGLHMTFKPLQMNAFEMQKAYLSFYEKEFSLQFLLHPSWLFNMDILRHHILIHSLKKMFARDMDDYCSFLEMHSRT